MQCPGCGLINPPSAVRCDCGLALQGASTGEIDKLHRNLLAAPQRRRTIGIVLMVVGGLPALGGILAGMPAAFLTLANLPFIAGAVITAMAQARIRSVRELSQRAELPQAKLLAP